MEARLMEEDTDEREEEEEEEEENRGLLARIFVPKSNVMLLGVTCFLFGSFALAEMVAAISSNSLSLLGDASTMIVDAITYVLNMFAEKRKGKGISERTRIKLEFFIPLFSVVALVGTSIYVLQEAIDTIKNPPKEENTADSVMLVFSSVNLLIDIVSMFCFARMSRLLGFPSVDTDGDVENNGDNIPHDRYERLGATSDGNATSQEPRKSNTNMCSAYTHVVADTMRSIAVMVAASLSRSRDDVNPDLADAWAAVVVSVIIFLSILPLLKGLYLKFKQLI